MQGCAWSGYLWWRWSGGCGRCRSFPRSSGSGPSAPPGVVPPDLLRPWTASSPRAELAEVTSWRESASSRADRPRDPATGSSSGTYSDVSRALVPGSGPWGASEPTGNSVIRKKRLQAESGYRAPRPARRWARHRTERMRERVQNPAARNAATGAEPPGNADSGREHAAQLSGERSTLRWPRRATSIGSAPGCRRLPRRHAPGAGRPRARRSPALPGRRHRGGQGPNCRGAGRPPSRAGR